MYLPYWSLLVIFSVVSSIIAFLWGHRSGQFTDQKRASFLALNEEYITSTSSSKPCGSKRQNRFLVIFFGVIFTVMIISCLITFIMAV